MGRAVVLQAVRLGHFANFKPLRITVLDREAHRHRDEFLAAYPQFGKVCESAFIAADTNDAASRKLLTDIAADESLLPYVAICFDDDERSIECALNLPQGVRDRKVPVAVRLGRRSALCDALGQCGNAAPSCRAFGVVEDELSVEDVFLEGLDAQAKAVHEDYKRGEDEKLTRGEEGNKTEPWERAPEEDRRASRQQADHIDVKLRAVGCEAVAKDTAGRAPVEFSAEEAELLACVEHNRWMAAKHLEAYAFGPETDRARRLHPALIPYEQLPEGTKEKDRKSVTNVPALLKLVGKVIVRKVGT
jgi:hypothetical protein